MFEAIASHDAIVVGISTDSVESHSRFRASLGLPYNLLSDPGKRVMALYGVKGRLPLLPNKRVTYLVTKEGAIAGVYHHEMAMRRHVEDVIEGLRALPLAPNDRRNPPTSPGD